MLTDGCRCVSRGRSRGVRCLVGVLSLPQLYCYCMYCLSLNQGALVLQWKGSGLRYGREGQPAAQWIPRTRSERSPWQEARAAPQGLESERGARSCQTRPGSVWGVWPPGRGLHLCCPLAHGFGRPALGRSLVMLGGGEGPAVLRREARPSGSCPSVVGTSAFVYGAANQPTLRAGFRPQAWCLAGPGGSPLASAGSPVQGSVPSPPRCRF